MSRAGRAWVATLAGLAGVLALPATVAQAEEPSGRLKICAYNYDRTVRVTVDGDGFADFPGDGDCESERVRSGSHQIRTVEDAGFTSGEVMRDGASVTFYTLPVSVQVDDGEQTRVNLYFF